MPGCKRIGRPARSSSRSRCAARMLRRRPSLQRKPHTRTSTMQSRSSDRKRWSKSLPLPPGGAAVLAAYRDRRQLNTFICAGPDSWNRHKLRLDRVVLPPDAAPDDFDWRIFRGQEPTVIADDADQGRITRLIWLLLRAQA